MMASTTGSTILDTQNINNDGKSHKRNISKSSIDMDIDKFELMENLILNKIDSLLTNFENKLSMEVGETAAIIKSYTPTYTSIVNTLKSVKSYLNKNHQYNLHPLSQIIDEFEYHDNDHDNEPSKFLKSIQLLNAQLTDFEKHHNLPSLTTHPNERLIALKDTLYNYDSAMTISNFRHLNFFELPFQWRENKFIIYGYRFAKSHVSAITSLFYWHNETVNIWTHLLGACYLLYLGLFDYPNSNTYQIYGPSKNDHLIMYLFITSAIICLMFSVIWHSYTNIGYLNIRSKFACFDYSGITILITSSIITTEHISLKDYPNMRLMFVICSIIAGLVGIGMAWHPYFDKPESRIIRILFFVSLAGLGVISFLCSCFVHNISYCLNLFSPLLFSFGWYLSGVVFYGSFFPECIRSDVEIDNFQISDETIMKLDKSNQLLTYLRKQPKHTCHSNKFSSLWWIDWIGNSHNLWHIFVIGGVLGHYHALLEMFKRAYQ